MGSLGACIIVGAVNGLFGSASHRDRRDTARSGQSSWRPSLRLGVPSTANRDVIGKN